MRSILDEMNNLAMLKSDEMILKPQRIPIQEVLTLACEGIKDMAHTHDQTLVTAFSNEPLYVRVDVNKMTLAFTNLLNNALRFSPPRTDITVGAIRDDHHVLVWVQDRGRGIPVDELQRIFEEFYQIESPDKRSYGGLGIGLTLARGLIEAQGGRIWAESEGPGGGATFKVLLPAV
jgi:signal transduction histidine kinase